MRPISQSIPLASPEIRDAVFRELIRYLPLQITGKNWLTGPSGLLSRGLLERHTTSYGVLPPMRLKMFRRRRAVAHPK
jgi:hypothetical protein